MTWFMVAYAFGFTQLQLIGPFADKDACLIAKTQMAQIERRVDLACTSFISPK